MENWPEVIRHGRLGRVLRLHGQRNAVDYLVLASDPGRRRRFAKPQQAIDYLMELERRDRLGESASAAGQTERRSWLDLGRRPRGGR